MGEVPASEVIVASANDNSYDDTGDHFGRASPIDGGISRDESRANTPINYWNKSSWRKYDHLSYQLSEVNYLLASRAMVRHPFLSINENYELCIQSL